MQQLDDNSGRAVFSTWSVPIFYKQGARSVPVRTRVKAGSNTSTVILRVVGGDEKGSLKSETVKYGCESQGTRTRERLSSRGPTAYPKDRPVHSSERESPRYSLDRRLGGAPEPVWTTWRRENSWPYRDSNSDPAGIQPVASRCTDWLIVAHFIVRYTGTLFGRQIWRQTQINVMTFNLFSVLKINYLGSDYIWQ
jgi:hypothetical protein